MKNLLHTSKLIAFLFFSLFIKIQEVNAQQAFVALGIEASGAGGSASISIGQIGNNTFLGSGGSIYEGMQQPLEIFIETGLNELTINLSLSVYPNPTTDYVTLSIQEEDLQNISYELIDIKGRSIIKEFISNDLTEISMSSLPIGMYFIKVIRNSAEIKTFKIIKTL